MTDATPESAPPSAAASAVPVSPPPASTVPATPPPAPAGAPANDDSTGPAARPLWAALASPFGAGFFLTLGGLVALVLGVAVSNLSTVIIYIVFALFAALGLDPVVRFLGRRGLSRAWSITLVYIGFAVILVGILWLIIPTVVQQITQFVQDLPGIVGDFMAGDIYKWLESTFGDSVGDLVGDLQTFVTDPANIAAIGGGVLRVGASIATGVSGLLIILVLSLYFLASLPSIKASFVRVVPARNRAGVASMTEQISDSIGGYLAGMVVLALCNSILAFFLYLLLGLPFPALMAVVAFCLTLIPLVGSVLFWVVASVLALFTNPVAALVFAVVYLVYMQVEAYVLTPRVMNRAISVPGSLVVIGALVGGTLLGLPGALVAIPVTASILLIIKQVIVPRQDAKV
jgi:predicted PurR-regulated permease PerM